MERERRDSKAGGNVLLMQYGIGRNPRTQLCGQLMTLLGIGFRHQNYEFVASVSRNDIVTPAVLLQNMGHTLQHNVPVQVAVEIVDELEAVQIQQNHRERPA